MISETVKIRWETGEAAVRMPRNVTARSFLLLYVNSCTCVCVAWGGCLSVVTVGASGDGRLGLTGVVATPCTGCWLYPYADKSYNKYSMSCGIPRGANCKPKFTDIHIFHAKTAFIIGSKHRSRLPQTC